MRDYVPLDDGLEPTDFDEYIDYPAQTSKDVAARIYIKVERDPQRAARLAKRQNAAIMDALRWIYANRAQLRDKGFEVPESWPDICGPEAAAVIFSVASGEPMRGSKIQERPRPGGPE